MAGLGFIFIVLPISIILFVVLAITKKKIFGIALLTMWGFLIFLWILSIVLQPFYTKKVLDRSDFYGTYVIDRNYFAGKQTDWQYNTFRFEIKRNDSIYFYVTDGNEINQTYKGIISTIAPYKSARLKIEMTELGHHVLSSNPTIYRDVWGFYLVFHSPKYHNMYFRKGKWEELN